MISPRKDLDHDEPTFSSRIYQEYAAASPAWPATASPAVDWTAEPRDPLTVVEGLLAGNRRFAAGRGGAAERRSLRRRLKTAARERPTAAVLTCADSRVAPELIFDQGIGDLFVVRVAGGALGAPGSAVEESLEHAVTAFDTPVVVVQGHRGCDAIAAAVDRHITPPHRAAEGAVAQSLEPAAEAALSTEPSHPLDAAIRWNTLFNVALRTSDTTIGRRAHSGRLVVVGAVYDLESGRVAVVA